MHRPFMIQISEGSTRVLDERALRFLRTYAKRIEVLDAKELGLDAIHDTVHEMARDEARHGKALKGLLERYFG